MISLQIDRNTYVYTDKNCIHKIVPPTHSLIRRIAHYTRNCGLIWYFMYIFHFFFFSFNTSPSFVLTLPHKRGLLIHAWEAGLIHVSICTICMPSPCTAYFVPILNGEFVTFTLPWGSFIWMAYNSLNCLIVETTKCPNNNLMNSLCWTKFIVQLKCFSILLVP